MKGIGEGKHNNCDVCHVKEIKDKKKNEFKKNIKYLEELSKTVQKSIDYLKKKFDDNNKEKEELKKEIQKIFTKIRNTLNEREDFF